MADINMAQYGRCRYSPTWQMTNTANGKRHGMQKCQLVYQGQQLVPAGLQSKKALIIVLIRSGYSQPKHLLGTAPHCTACTASPSTGPFQRPRDLSHGLTKVRSCLNEDLDHLKHGNGRAICDLHSVGIPTMSLLLSIVTALLWV